MVPSDPPKHHNRGGSAEAWVGHSERVCGTGSSQQELGRERAGKAGDGLYHGHPSPAGSAQASLSSLLLAINSSPAREDGRARRSS